MRYFISSVSVALCVWLVAAPAAAQAIDPAGTATYRRARRILDDQPRRAFKLAQTLPAFGHADDRRLDLLAKSAEAAGDVDAANAALAELADAAVRPIDRLYAHVERAELLLLQGQLARASRAIDAAKHAANHVDGDSPSARFFEARRWRLVHDLAVAQGAGQSAVRARRAATELLVAFPAEAPAVRPGLGVSVADLDAHQRFERARHLYDHWAYKAARRAFAALRQNPTYAGRARWYLAHIGLNKLRDRPARAESQFAYLADHGPHRAESLYQVARAQMRQEHYDQARDTLSRYHTRYPRGRHTESVFYYRGWLAYDHRQNKQAIAGFKDYIQRYGKHAGRSSYIYGFLAWTYMRLGRWKQAIATYEKMRSFGNMLVWGKALYWQAYAYRQLGHTAAAVGRLDELRDRYAVTYYGVLGEQLRARIQGNDPHASKVWWPDDGGHLDDTPKQAAPVYKLAGLSTSQRKRWRRVQALVSLGDKVRARGALDPIYDDLVDAAPTDKRQKFVHALGFFVGNYHPMWTRATGGSIAAMPAPPDPTSLAAAMAYPRTYPNVVDTVTDEFDIPAELMWSLMRQESRYRPAQVSYTNAVGALQMIPKTARKVAAALGVRYNLRTFSTPSVGFRYSGYYLRQLLDHFDGHIVPAAAAYNSGADVVDHWIDQNPDVPFAWLIEEFAYNEGRNYCRKVAEHMVRYLYLYEDDPTRRGRILDALFPVFNPN